MLMRGVEVVFRAGVRALVEVVRAVAKRGLRLGPQRGFMLI
jgi:hypothetical protein